MDTDTEIRNAMKRELDRRGWPQQKLADELGVGKSSLSQLLNGDYAKIPASLLNALDALGLKLTVERKPVERTYDPVLTGGSILPQPKPERMVINEIEGERPGYRVEVLGGSFSLVRIPRPNQPGYAELEAINAPGYVWTSAGIRVGGLRQSVLARVEEYAEPGQEPNFDALAREAAHYILQRPPFDPASLCF